MWGVEVSQNTDVPTIYILTSPFFEIIFEIDSFGYNKIPLMLNRRILKYYSGTLLEPPHPFLYYWWTGDNFSGAFHNCLSLNRVKATILSPKLVFNIFGVWNWESDAPFATAHFEPGWWFDRMVCIVLKIGANIDGVISLFKRPTN